MISFFVVVTGEQNKKKIIYIPVSEEGTPTTEIEMGEFTQKKKNHSHPPPPKEKAKV
jgi:hypothetical protein